MERLESLKQLFVDTEKDCLKRITNISEKRSMISFLNLNSEDLALYSMYILHDFQKARNDFYKAAVSGEYMVKTYDELMGTSIYKICCALLSDNSLVIKHYSTLRNSKWSNTFIGHQFNASIQAVLLNSFTELEMQLEYMKKTIQTKKWKGSAGYYTVFTGLLNQDKGQIETGLQELVKTFGKRGEFGLAKRYFSFDIAALAKLAWKKGFDIKVNSPLVPKEMLPVQELLYYIGYDFFKELDENYT
jgi:hypothetical protein